MKSDNVDLILAEAARSGLPPGAERAAIENAQGVVISDLHEVRPLPPVWVYTLGLVVLFALIAMFTGTVLGLHGFHALNSAQASAIFASLLCLAWLAAMGCATEMRPAAGTRIGATISLVIAVVLFPVLFSALFHGYVTQNFVGEGIPCLLAGLEVAIPTGIAIGYILRRGFVMQWITAGIAAGTLAGLTGLAMLELHCSNLKAIHTVVWHVAVVALSGILGLGVGWIVDWVKGNN